jgi:hypothetical protein
MLFSSLAFLYLFLRIALEGYYLLPRIPHNTKSFAVIKGTK